MAIHPVLLAVAALFGFGLMLAGIWLGGGAQAIRDQARRIVLVSVGIVAIVTLLPALLEAGRGSFDLLLIEGLAVLSALAAVALSLRFS